MAPANSRRPGTRGSATFSARMTRARFGHSSRPTSSCPELPGRQADAASRRARAWKNPRPRPFPWFWVAVGVTLLSAAAFGAQFLPALAEEPVSREPVRGDHGCSEAASSRRSSTCDKDRPYDAASAQIPGSIRLAPEELASGVSGLELDAHAGRWWPTAPRPRKTVSARVARDLRKLGFKDVLVLRGGMGAWTNAGLPIETRSDISAVGLELYKALAGGTG